MNETKIKAVLVELFQNDRTVTESNGEKTVKKGETRRYWYACDQYPTETVDYGDYWDVCCDSTVWLATPDDVSIVNDSETIRDWLGLPDVKPLDEIFKLAPGQWIEMEYDNWGPTGCRVRATAYDRLPPVSAKMTIGRSDLSNLAMSRIKINGKPLYESGTMSYGRTVWVKDLRKVIENAILSELRNNGGPLAEVSIKRPNSVSIGSESSEFTVVLTAKTRNDLVSFLRNARVINPETVKITETAGDEAGPKTVRAYVTFTDELV